MPRPSGLGSSGHRPGLAVMIPARIVGDSPDAVTSGERQHPTDSAYLSCRVQVCLPVDDPRKLTATMTATVATSPDHRRAPATIRALVIPQDLVKCHT